MTDTAEAYEHRLANYRDQLHEAQREIERLKTLAQPTDEEIAKAAESSEWGSKYTTELAFTHGAYWALAKMKGEER